MATLTANRTAINKIGTKTTNDDILSSEQVALENTIEARINEVIADLVKVNQDAVPDVALPASTPSNGSTLTLDFDAAPSSIQTINVANPFTLEVSGDVGQTSEGANKVGFKVLKFVTTVASTVTLGSSIVGSSIDLEVGATEYLVEKVNGVTAIIAPRSEGSSSPGASSNPPKLAIASQTVANGDAYSVKTDANFLFEDAFPVGGQVTVFDMADRIQTGGIEIHLEGNASTLEVNGSTLTDPSPSGGFSIFQIAASSFTSDSTGLSFTVAKRAANDFVLSLIESESTPAGSLLPNPATLAEAKALSTSLYGQMNHQGNLYTFQSGDFTGLADDIGVIKADDTNINTGAWVVWQPMRLTRDGAGNGLELTADNIRIVDTILDMDYDTLGLQGHGFAFVDANDLTIDNVKVLDFGNNGGVAGTGIIAYRDAQVATVKRQRVYNSFVKGNTTDSDNTNGILFEDSWYSFMLNNIVEDVVSFAHELKHDARYSVLSNLIAVNSKYALGYGQSDVGLDGADFNIAMGIVSHDCEQLLIIGESSHNLFIGMLTDPAGAGVGTVYGVHISDDSTNNAVIGALTAGNNVTHPVRIRGTADGNYVSLISHDDAANIVTLDAGAERNVIDVLHAGSRNSILGAIADNSGNPVAGSTGNVVYSRATGEQLGSLSGVFSWFLKSLGASFLSSHEIRFQGTLNTILGLGVDTGGIGGISVGKSASSNLASLTYGEAAGYWTVRANGTNAYRFYSTVLRPDSDNAIDLGTGAVRFKDIYAANATIQTSDERVKTEIQPIDDKVLDAWADVDFVQYKWKDSVEEKGGQARVHFGVIAQRVKAAFESHGLNAFGYGLLCYDEWERDEYTDEEGNVSILEAGDRYGVRYEECMVLEMALMRRRLDRAGF